MTRTRLRSGRWTAGLLIIMATLITAACTPTPPPPSPTPAPELQEEIVARLRRNADTFEYAIGKHGGTITYATITEPLTFNLAIAHDRRLVVLSQLSVRGADGDLVADR